MPTKEEPKVSPLTENGVFCDKYIQSSQMIGTTIATMEGYYHVVNEMQSVCPDLAVWAALKIEDMAEELAYMARSYRESMAEFKLDILNSVALKATEPTDEDEDEEPDQAARDAIANEASILARRSRTSSLRE